MAAPFAGTCCALLSFFFFLCNFLESELDTLHNPRKMIPLISQLKSLSKKSYLFNEVTWSERVYFDQASNSVGVFVYLCMYFFGSLTLAETEQVVLLFHILIYIFCYSL